MNYLDINREAWNKRTKIHMGSSFYDVKGFEDGNTSLREIELSELGEIGNKSILHLQCHFGLDSLSLARDGAIVTGVDLSPESIAQAKKLSDKVGIDASFVCSDIYEYESKNKYEGFDIIYTSYGALCWLPCLNKWAALIEKYLKPGGKFYMVEFHPFNDFLDGEPYFHSPESRVLNEGTYTDGSESVETDIVTWSHPLSSVVNALINKGLTIEWLNEFTFSPYNCFNGLEEREKGRYYKAHRGNDAPLVYSLCAAKCT